MTSAGIWTPPLLLLTFQSESCELTDPPLAELELLDPLETTKLLWEEGKRPFAFRLSSLRSLAESTPWKTEIGRLIK